MKKTILLLLFLFNIFVISLFSIDNENLKTQSQNKCITIIIDPAHGGIDTGAIVSHFIKGEEIILVEKDITLNIAQQLKAKILDFFSDINVILIRNDDRFVSVDDKIFLANNVYLNEEGIAIYISIHTNSSSKSQKNGYSITISNKIDNNIVFAEKVSSEFKKLFEEDLIFNGIIQDNFNILNKSNIPASIILDYGFITNNDDFLFLCSEQNLEKCSTALLNGIIEYIETL